MDTQVTFAYAASFPERLWYLNGVYAEVAQLVEHLLAMQKVAGSNPVFRSKSLPRGFMRKWLSWQLVERPTDIQYIYVYCLCT